MGDDGLEAACSFKATVINADICLALDIIQFIAVAILSTRTLIRHRQRMRGLVLFTMIFVIAAGVMQVAWATLLKYRIFDDNHKKIFWIGMFFIEVCVQIMLILNLLKLHQIKIHMSD